MACKSCGTPHNPVVDMNKRERMTMEKIQELFNSGKYKLVRFNGHTYTATIGSPTGIIAKDGLYNYGRGKNGDIFLVHVDDISKEPTTFTILSSGSDAYNQGLTKFELSANKVEKKSKPVEVKVEVPVQEEPEEEEILSDVEEEEEPIQPQREKEESTSLIHETKRLSRAEAIPMADFRDAYGFTHHMQVQAKIKSGEILSYRNEDENLTYVYHYEE